MEATAAIREREGSSGTHIPIIAMTAHAMRGDRERCLAGGMDGYISKPIHPRDLFAEIERCLAGTQTSTTTKFHSEQAAERLDRASLLERLEGDEELLAEIIKLFVEDAPRQLVTMRAAIQQGDMVVLQRAAHSMKGAAGNFYAHVTVAAALELEQNAKNLDGESSKASLAKLEGALNHLLPALAELCQGVSK